MSEAIRILVASQNKVKSAATFDAFNEYLNTECSVELSKDPIKSGVADQPLSLVETALGAVNRISQISKNPNYDYFVAVEGGMYSVAINGIKQWYESACAAVATPNTKPSVAFGPAYPVPKKLSVHIEKGLDLNQAMEIETGIKEIGNSVGFNGWLTNDRFDRRRASSQAVILALYGHSHG